MKLFLLALLILPEFALASFSACAEKTRLNYAHEGGQISDIPYRINEGKVHPRAEMLRDYRGRELGSFPQDVLVFEVSGSYWSGWFTDFVVVDPHQCRILAIHNVYAE